MEGTILIIDDEERNLKMLENMLLPEGYKVLKANNGTDALEILRTETVHAVLTDIMMPGISGFDVLKKIRENKELAALSVIILTSLTDKEERIKGLELGADDFISKPFDLDELRAKINTQVKLNYLRMQLNERAKLVKVINKIDEGVIIANSDFVPVSINTKARELLGVKEIPVNILSYLKEKFSEDIRVSDERINVILKQKTNQSDNAPSISLTIELIKDSSGEVDSYIFILKKNKLTGGQFENSYCG
ncbi:MAG: hypothetical protein A2231_11225 [Candidatus Firestonebacteria bacterium RIFOXYA2_FULL_40_8]|nr:MAG: hypothetical protein A2231_11225 [Candidatus Firestonebacteria bacterium RIFOXYA2_FULL_40_8]